MNSSDVAISDDEVADTRARLIQTAQRTVENAVKAYEGMGLDELAAYKQCAFSATYSNLIMLTSMTDEEVTSAILQ
jgi:hypothetical protein